MIRICVVCGKKYSTYPANTQKYCSSPCYWSTMKTVNTLGTVDGMTVYKDKMGYVRISLGQGKDRLLHVYIAEKALGKPLSKGALVHHVDGDPLNNSRDNLVILQNQSEHNWLHARKRVIEKGGHPKTHKWCCRCKTLKLLEQFCSNPTRYMGRHTECRECMREVRKARAERETVS